jgi:uncharacterized membrane protein YeaQ/YmgE (transglycosylase-associated protein family)
LIHIPTAPAVHYLFDALAWASSLARGVALYRWRLSETATRIAQATGSGYFAALAAGAGLGAWAAGSLNTLRSVTPTLSHSVAGALVGAIVAVELYKAVRGIKGSTGVVFTGPFASGVVVGRLGCFFAGLADFTYGVPTRLPWGVDLGDGIARHPVQIYESLSMLAFLYGAQRFVWEFLKPYPKLIGPFNLFHLLSFALMLYGGIAYGRDVIAERRAAQERALPVLRPDDQPV